MNTVCERYQDWALRTYKTIACNKDSGIKTAFSAIVNTKFSTLFECEQHSHKLIRLTTTLLESRSGLRWLDKLSEDCRLWSEILETEMMHGGLDIPEIVSGLVHGRLTTERALDLVR